MSPLALKILLHCYVSSEPYENISSDIYMEIITFFTVNGLVKLNPTENIYRTTKKGEAFVKMILSTPMPEKVYINPVTKKAI